MFSLFIFAFMNLDDPKIHSSQFETTVFTLSLQISILIYMMDSNRHPLTSLSHITDLFKGFLISASFPNFQIYGRFIG